MEVSEANVQRHYAGVASEQCETRKSCARALMELSQRLPRRLLKNTLTALEPKCRETPHENAILENTTLSHRGAKSDDSSARCKGHAHGIVV